MEFRHCRAWGSLALLSSLPMLGAGLGGLADERRQLGFTTWRAACRAEGLRLGTLIDFTFQLLPWAIIGMLLGGLALLVVGGLQHRRHAEACLAAHAGCALCLPLALALCALLSPAWMLAADAALVTVVSGWLLIRLRTPSRARTAHP